MSHQFQGFDKQGEAVPAEPDSAENSDSSAEVSEYESTVNSGSNTPTKAKTSSTTPFRSKGQTAGNVKNLVTYFSSDSDATEQHPPTTRRRRSATEHRELPAGGERELRKKIMAQAAADETLKLWQANLGFMKTTLDEAQQDLDQNKPRGVLLGHAAGVAAAMESAQEAWELLSSYFADNTVALQKYDLMLTRTKSRTRCSKVLANIAALTNTSDSATGTSTITLRNPTSFGDLALPEFDGDFTVFDSFEGNWKETINNGDLDDGAKKAYLIRSLKGEARDFIGTDGLASKTYEDIWKELRSRYGKPWRITRAAVKKLTEIKSPSDSPKDISRYWNDIMQACKVVERLELTASSVILNMALLKLPVGFRSRMDEKIRPLSPKYILSREIVAEPFNDVIAGELEKPSGMPATLGFNTIPQIADNKQNNNNHKKSKHNGKGKRNYCLLCQQKGQTHKTWQCPVYNTGQLARDRMKALGRCQYCAVVMSEHGQECSHRVHCSQHPQQRHMFWLCANYTNATHKQIGNKPTPQQHNQYQYPQPHQYPQQPQNPYQQPYHHQTGSSQHSQGRIGTQP